MIKINLLPYWEKEKKEDLKRQIFILGASLVIFILVISSLYIYVTWAVASLQSDIQKMQEKTALLAKKVGDVEAQMKRKKEIEQKLAIIEGLERDRLFPVRLLKEMSYVTPVNNVWLNKVAQKDREVRIDGFARHNMAVAQFMKNLEKSGFITEVELVVSKREEVEKHFVQRFVVTGKLSQQGP